MSFSKNKIELVFFKIIYKLIFKVFQKNYYSHKIFLNLNVCKYGFFLYFLKFAINSNSNS